MVVIERRLKRSVLWRLSAASPGKCLYFPARNCRIGAYWLFGSGGSDIRLKTDTCLFAFGPGGSDIRLKTIHASCFFYGFTTFFLSRGPRAQRAEIFEATSYPLTKIYSLIEIRV